MNARGELTTLRWTALVQLDLGPAFFDVENNRTKKGEEYLGKLFSAMITLRIESLT